MQPNLDESLEKIGWSWQDLPRAHPYRREMEKWEQRGYNPANHPYPKMLYRAQQRPDGAWSVGEALDRMISGQPGSAEQFSNSCQTIVKSEEEHRKAREQGWRDSSKEAMEYRELLDKSIADAAAYRHWQDRNLSEAAKAEAEEADAATMEHVAEVPAKRRGRPRKNPEAS
jgi:hypothetical protein